MFASLDPGSFTASIQATGPVPPRHVDRGKPTKGLSSGAVTCGPAPSCLFPRPEEGLEFQRVMHNAQKESYSPGQAAWANFIKFRSCPPPPTPAHGAAVQAH